MQGQIKFGELREKYVRLRSGAADEENMAAIPCMACKNGRWRRAPPPAGGVRGGRCNDNDSVLSRDLGVDAGAVEFRDVAEGKIRLDPDGALEVDEAPD